MNQNKKKTYTIRFREQLFIQTVKTANNDQIEQSIVFWVLPISILTPALEG